MVSGLEKNCFADERYYIWILTDQLFLTLANDNAKQLLWSLQHRVACCAQLSQKWAVASRPQITVANTEMSAFKFFPVSERNMAREINLLGALDRNKSGPQHDADAFNGRSVKSGALKLLRGGLTALRCIRVGQTKRCLITSPNIAAVITLLTNSGSRHTNLLNGQTFCWVLMFIYLSGIITCFATQFQQFTCSSDTL